MQIRAARDRTPLCVKVYDEIAEAITRDGLQPGQALPGEVSLAADLRVSRTVLREALLLLEEDGRLVRHHGKRWTVADRSEHIVAFSAGLPQILGGRVVPGARLQARLIEPDSFTRDHFGVDDQVLTWETTFTDGHHSIASALEFMIVGEAPSSLLDEHALAGAHDLTRAPATLLDAIGAGYRARLSPVLWRMSAVSSSSERLSWLDLGPSAVPVMLTVGLGEHGRATYLAKHIVDLSRVSPTIDLIHGDAIDHHEVDEFLSTFSVGRP